MSRKICAITAATSGLGRALCNKFAENGYGLIIHSRKEIELTHLAEKLKKKFKIRVKAFVGDLLQSEICKSLGQTLASEKCRVLINNAGEACPGLPLEELKAEQIEKLISVNLKVPIFLSKAMMTVAGATVININSIMALEPKSKRSVYSAVRAGLMGFTEAMFAEAQEKDMRFIGVYPSRIKTRPEYEFGMETEEVAAKIFNFYENETGSKLILDGRPPKFKKETK